MMFHCRDGLQFIYSSTEGLLGSFQVLSVMTCYCCLVTKSCLTLCDPMDCSLPGSSVLGILQARILEWVAISSSRGSSPPRDRTRISCIGRGTLPLSYVGRLESILGSRNTGKTHLLLCRDFYPRRGGEKRTI